MITCLPPSLREVAFSQENDGGSLLDYSVTPSVSLRSTAPSKRERKIHFALINFPTNYSLYNETANQKKKKGDFSITLNYTFCINLQFFPVFRRFSYQGRQVFAQGLCIPLPKGQIPFYHPHQAENPQGQKIVLKNAENP